MPDVSQAPVLNSRKQSLSDFVAWVQKHIRGDEKGEAQIFLDRLFKGYGHLGVKEAGATLEERIKKADNKGTAFADLVWRPRVLIEMKKRGEDLGKHYRQAFDYWARLVPNRPNYVVLCNFDEFWIYDFETQMDTPKDRVSLKELPDLNGALAFLSPINETPVFQVDHLEVTREAADKLAMCFNSIVARNVSRPDAQRFILQMLVALFAEDIGLLEQYTVIRLIEQCKRKEDSYDLLGGLFAAMNEKEKRGGRYRNVPYFNGGLFAEPARLELAPNEINLIRTAAEFKWSNVRPEIFGTLFEHSLGGDDSGRAERHAFGQHFTSPVDIMRIVGPTIVDPWREEIEGAKSLAHLRQLYDRLSHFTVLDPACGSGNFLYTAYRELKRLEKRLFQRMQEEYKTEREPRMGFLTAANFYGMDISPFAVELAKVTMVIARKLAIDELHITENALPLDNLDQNFLKCDALLDENGGPTSWPKADVIIGNPPFLDARKIAGERGLAYVKALRKCYPEVPGRADYCVYWFRRAHQQLPKNSVADPCSGRAGLVGTNTIRQNYSRIGGLDYICNNGGTITDAVSSQVWSGDAVVNVSIANWVNGSSNRTKTLAEQLGDRRDSPWRYENPERITSALTSGTDVVIARVLDVAQNPKRCFEGLQPGHLGFRITQSERRHLVEGDAKYREVTFPYLTGTEMLTASYQRDQFYIIDFGDRDLLEASLYEIALRIVKERVLPDWTKGAESENKLTGKKTGEHQNRLQTWWKLKRRRRELMAAIAQLTRYVVCVRHTKRPIFEFCHKGIRPDSSLTVFAFEDDYSFGILQSNVHWQWFVSRCSTIKRDWRYTSETVFDSYPWPQRPTKKQIESVGKAALFLRNVRNNTLRGMRGGLRTLYRTLELPGNNPLKDAHAALDAAVLDAYGFSAKKDLLTQLLKLNLEVADRIQKGEPVISPGMPPSYPNPKTLVTNDCILVDE